MEQKLGASLGVAPPVAGVAVNVPATIIIIVAFTFLLHGPDDCLIIRRAIYVITLRICIMP